MADTLPSETVPPEAPSNEVTTAAAAPAANVADQAEVERLKKEQEKKDLRIRQLENEAAARDRADEEARTKKLEEQQEYKTLAEQERDKREKLEAEIAATERQKELKEASDKTLADYNDETRKLVKDLGITLTDATDEAVQEFRTKLDAAQAQLSGSRVTPNNGNPPPTDGQEPTGAELYVILNDPIKRDEYYRKYKPVTADMMGPEK